MIMCGGFEPQKECGSTADNRWTAVHRFAAGIYVDTQIITYPELNIKIQDQWEMI